MQILSIMKYSIIFLILTLFSTTSCNSTNAENKYAVDPTDASARASGQDKEEDISASNDLAENKIDPFISEEGRFSVLFPGPPQKKTESIPTEVGPIDITIYLYQEGATLAYLIGHSDYPQEIIKNVDVNEMLKGVQDDVVRKVSAKVIKDEKIMLNEKYAGKYFTAKSEKINLIYELYLVDNRLFQIGVISTQSLEENPMFKKFMKSFQILPTNTNTSDVQ